MTVYVIVYRDTDRDRWNYGVYLATTPEAVWAYIATLPQEDEGFPLHYEVEEHEVQAIPLGP